MSGVPPLLRLEASEKEERTHDLLMASIATVSQRTPARLSRLVGGNLAQSAAHIESVAKAIHWLCSDAACNVTGITMPVDGGYIVP